MSLWLLAVVLLTTPRTPCLSIECNHFGDLESCQYIALDGYECNGNTTIHPLDWTWAKDAELYHVGGEWILLNRGRVFVIRNFRETVTERDPEMMDRDLLPERQRKCAAASVVWGMVGR